jgi:uncharacterized repeat protein (TIGR03803 family)
MRRNKLSIGTTRLLVTVTMAVCFTSTHAAAQQESVMYRFDGLTDGALPAGGLVEFQGDFYAMTGIGGNTACGSIGCGAVVQLAPPQRQGEHWMTKTIYTFQGGLDGASPWGSLAVDRKGNLYGATYNGGAGCNSGGCGTVFELTPPSTVGAPWTETVLYRFQGGSDGAFPETSPTLDGAGNVYGTTTQGGQGDCLAYGCGTVFEISPPAAPGGAWTESILYRFQGAADGMFPQYGLALGPKGVLYGSAEPLAFQLTPPSAPGDPWTYVQLYSWGDTGAGPSGNLTLRQGVLYGATGNSSNGDAGGTVFQVSPSQGGSWRQKTLYSFSYSEPDSGYVPVGNLSFDSNGNIYGITLDGGTGVCHVGCGTVFELSPPSAPNNPWTESVVYSFLDGADGHDPAGLIMVEGLLYGTTYYGGDPCSLEQRDGCGTVFSLRP